MESGAKEGKGKIAWVVRGAKGKRKVDDSFSAVPTYDNGLLNQIKNALGNYIGRTIEVTKGKGRYKKTKEGIILVDDEWEGEK